MTKKILVVDDDHTARHLLRDILTPEGYDILEAEDGRHALKILEQGPVDLIITDRSMPHMDGLEFLKQLHKKKVVIPSIMISAFGEEELWGKAVELGAVDYLVKPYKTERVVALVKRTLKHEEKPK
jgi:DNA-binding response OmpR family regulator